jgi:Methyltransferase domain
MKQMERQQHWDAVHLAKGEQDASWFEAVPEISLRMLEAAGLSTDSCVLDVGGGESRLVDQLLARGVSCLAVLDVSATALRRCRLGASASVPIWIQADVTGDWSLKPVDMWHDRAVFHFLTAPADRDRYRERLLGTLKPGGTAIVATFAPDGPETCSGLPVQRYSPRTLAAELGERFALVDSASHVHTTPWGSPQSFQYSRLERLP